MFAWPNPSSERTVSLCLFLLYDNGHCLTSVLISLNFLPSRPRIFHFWCHLDMTASLSDALISAWGIALWISSRGLSAASLAILSAFSFPSTFTWPGTQHNSILKSLSSALQRSSIISSKGGWVLGLGLWKKQCFWFCLFFSRKKHVFSCYFFFRSFQFFCLCLWIRTCNTLTSLLEWDKSIKCSFLSVKPIL